MDRHGHDGDEKERPLLVVTRETLETFDDDVRYLWSCSDVPVYENPPSALEFLRNHVAVSRPCIIRNSILRTPASETIDHGNRNCSIDGNVHDDAAVPLTITLDDLVRLFPEAGDVEHAAAASSTVLPPLCVDVTPDGHGDCLRKVTIAQQGASPRTPETTEAERVFVKPLETTMSLSEFCHRLRKGHIKQKQRENGYGCKNDGENILDTVFHESSSSPSPRSQDGLHGADNPGHAINNDESLFEDCVLYYSRQNDCLRQELSPLWNLKRSSMGHRGNDDNNDRSNVEEEDSFLFPRSFHWAEEAFFGQQVSPGPDAVNLWMGDERAVSAMHKDHYENLFYVLSGEKVFGLCPPSDAPFLYEREVLSGRFEVSSGNGTGHDDEKRESQQQRSWSVVLDREEDDCASGNQSSSDATTRYAKVHWIATDLFGARPDDTNRDDNDDDFPLSKHTHPITVTVRAGELLYLPSLWFHRVTQTRETIGINYWYDMNFESPLWCYFHLLQQLRPFVPASATKTEGE